MMNPEFPVFIPTKGRHETPYTILVLRRLGVPFRAVVEKPEYQAYLDVIGDPDSLLVLPHQNEGLTVTRNWIWDFAQHELKVPFFWTMDDNIRDFYRLNHNMKYRVTSGTFLRVMEDFVQRFENVAIAGMQYEMFAPRKKSHPPFKVNTRIYSNMLIKTDIPYRNRLFYNDDTDLCLQVLKGGQCTVLFFAFLCDKIATMRVKGGNTDFYDETQKRLEFARELQRAHPDVVKIIKRYGRWHHKVDYKPFQANQLKLKPGLEIQPGVNDYGMKMVKLDK